jgi:hypothetical protein
MFYSSKMVSLFALSLFHLTFKVQERLRRFSEVVHTTQHFYLPAANEGFAINTSNLAAALAQDASYSTLTVLTKK